MSSSTSRLQLTKLADGENFSNSVLNANWDKVDNGYGTLNSQLANLPNVAYTSITGTSLSAFESALTTALNGMGTGQTRVCPAYANYSQSVTNGGQAIAFLSKTASTIWYCFLVFAGGVKAGYYTGSAWTWL